MIRKDFRKNWVIYLIALPVIVFFAVFAYAPMVGVLMAFQSYQIKGGIFGSPWVGFKNFLDFFNSYYFGRLIKNTFLLSFYDLLLGFPAPILFALLMNELRGVKYKRVVQTITYMPYFISVVVIAGIIKDFFSSSGAVTLLLGSITGSTSNMIGDAANFRGIFVGTNIWQFLGFNSVIYMAALAGVDQELYDAAALDGAGRLGKAIHVTLPCIMSTIVILLILRIGNLLTVSFEKVLLLYAPSTYSVSDVIMTFTYRKGLQEFNYGYSTAVGLFNSVLNFLMLISANAISKKFTETSLF
ncbi:MAG: ABC transporter permease subunit [Clostridiales bacterium]|jgi:putative aldouronate transport system permease protein|nr:ABC transporter permease subunit [Clostridiales bacterium]